jgi:hypothetical protein
MQNSSQPLSNSVPTDIKHHQIIITTTIKKQGKKTSREAILKPRKVRRKTKA